MRAPRLLVAAAVLVLAVVAGALTLWSGGGDAGPRSTSGVAAEGAIVDWAVGHGGVAEAAPEPVPGSPAPEAGGEGGAPPPPAIAGHAADDGVEAVHPADAPQTTLLAAAGQPVGPGVTGPAADVSGGDQAPPVNPDDVLSATAARGGCSPDYGDPGQCLPARPPSASTQASAASLWTCADVRELFPDGLSAERGDPLRLDRDGDGVACGPGE